LRRGPPLERDGDCASTSIATEWSLAFLDLVSRATGYASDDHFRFARHTGAVLQRCHLYETTVRPIGFLPGRQQCTRERAQRNGSPWVDRPGQSAWYPDLHETSLLRGRFRL
jgi:hypothetical protein